MFTGIIEDVGTVKLIEKRGVSGRITVSTVLLDGLSPGDSICVDGACLTVTGVDASSFSADLSEETLRTTTLGGLSSGSRVNLERALTLAKPLGGHIVTGHVDGIGKLRSIISKEDHLDLEVEVPANLLNHIVRKGSVSVDGISLTVAEVRQKGFTVAVVPHTLKHTNLSFKKEGAKVNIETDMLAKYVERLLGERKEGITEEFLKEHGFKGS